MLMIGSPTFHVPNNGNRALGDENSAAEKYVAIYKLCLYLLALLHNLYEGRMIAKDCMRKISLCLCIFHKKNIMCTGKG